MNALVLLTLLISSPSLPKKMPTPNNTKGALQQRPHKFLEPFLKGKKALPPQVTYLACSIHSSIALRYSIFSTQKAIHHSAAPSMSV